MAQADFGIIDFLEGIGQTAKGELVCFVNSYLEIVLDDFSLFFFMNACRQKLFLPND